MYASFQALKALAPGWIDRKHEHGPFKLVLDDVGLASLLVRSNDDLTVVGMVDLEWVHAAPAQMAATAPWWLLMGRLTNYDVFLDGDEALAIPDRYLANLRLFQRVLVEEERKLLGDDNHVFSDLVEWSRTSGAMWFHMLLASGFHHTDLLPYHLLIEHVGRKRWEDLQRPFYEAPELKAFVERKVAEGDAYDKIADQARALKKDFESDTITAEAYIAGLQELVIPLTPGPEGTGKVP